MVLGIQMRRLGARALGGVTIALGLLVVSPAGALASSADLFVDGTLLVRGTGAVEKFVIADGGDGMTIVDTNGGPITVPAYSYGQRCRQFGLANAVTCAKAKSGIVYSGGSDDSIDAHGSSVGLSLYGELGNDTLIGSTGRYYRSPTYITGNLVHGDQGNDTITAQSRSDSIDGGEGNDTIDGGANCDDIDGGDGGDTVRYDNRSQGVVVSLEDGAYNDGGPLDNGACRPRIRGSKSPSRDSLFGVENVFGSLAADTLTGSSEPNVLLGCSGNDTIDGKAGADTILELCTPSGNDTIVARDGESERMIRCGDGTDVVKADRLPLDPVSVFRFDCEQIERL